jgi:hypothetical protein
LRACGRACGQAGVLLRVCVHVLAGGRACVRVCALVCGRAGTRADERACGGGHGATTAVVVAAVSTWSHSSAGEFGRAVVQLRDKIKLESSLRSRFETRVAKLALLTKTWRPNRARARGKGEGEEKENESERKSARWCGKTFEVAKRWVGMLYEWELSTRGYGCVGRRGRAVISSLNERVAYGTAKKKRLERK